MHARSNGPIYGVQCGEIETFRQFDAVRLNLAPTVSYRCSNEERQCSITDIVCCVTSGDVFELNVGVMYIQPQEIDMR